MKKIGSLSIINGSNVEIYYDRKAKENPYIVKEIRLGIDRYGEGENDWLYVPHTITVAKYADLASCTAFIHGYVLNHNEYGRQAEEEFT